MGPAVGADTPACGVEKRIVAGGARRSQQNRQEGVQQLARHEPGGTADAPGARLRRLGRFFCGGHLLCVAPEALQP